MTQQEEPADIAFLHCTGAMGPGEKELRTIRKFGSAYRRSRRRSKGVAPS